MPGPAEPMARWPKWRRGGVIAAAVFIGIFAVGRWLLPTPIPERSERIEFAAPTYVNFGAFRGGRGSPSQAAMTIHLPAGRGPFAAVMIAHSIGGWNERAEGSYVKPLLAAGYAVIALDHFGPRGIRRAADVPGTISPITPVSDALLALKIVADRPEIDRQRIGIMGLSLGGITSEVSAYEFVRRRVLGDVPLKFAAHVPFYAPCHVIFSRNPGPFTTGAPMLKLYAGRDETTPREKCARIEALVRAAEPGLRWEAIWYDDAYHAWEDPSRVPRFYPAHVNARKCPVMDFGARMRFVDVSGTERPFDAAEVQTCIANSAGYSMGYSEHAAKDSLQRMLAFFGQHLRPK